MSAFDTAYASAFGSAVAVPSSLARLLTQPCYLVQRTPGPPDEYGDPTWIETVTAARCYADQANAAEPGDVHYQSEDWRFVFQPGLPLDGLDAIELNGHRFDVVGPPWHAHNPRTNSVHHVELIARATAP